MDFEAYSHRLSSLHEFCNKQKPKNVKQKRFQIINCGMQMVSVNKTQFAGLNDKRFYFHDGIVALPYEHYLPEGARKLKEKYKSKIQHEIINQKYNFLIEESKAVSNYERLRILRSIFSLPPMCYLLNLKHLMRGQSYKSTREHILNSSLK